MNATISLFKCAYEELDKAPELKIGGIEDRLSALRKTSDQQA